MSIPMELNEGTAARRRVPCRIFLSDGTSPDTGALNDAVLMGVNSLATISLTSTLRAVNAAHGMYCVELSQSETSVLGIHPLYHTAGDFPQHIATLHVVNSNPYSTQSNLNLSANTVLGVTRLDSSVSLRAVVHSGATIQGLSRLNSNVTLNANTHSGATIAGIVDGGFISSTYAAGAIDAVALATDAGQEIADRVIMRSIEGGSDSGRSVGQALAPLCNKTAIVDDTLTVYRVDDTTPLWTASVTTGADPLSGIDPA